MYNVYFSFAEINQIAKGHMSDPLLFFTVPTSPPDDLKCILNSDKSLKFTWKLPRKGMVDSTKKTDMNYHFSFNCDTGFQRSTPMVMRFCQPGMILMGSRSRYIPTLETFHIGRHKFSFTL